MHGTCSKSSGELSPDGVASRALKERGEGGAEKFVRTKSGNVHWKSEPRIAFFLDYFRPFFVFPL
jgi:hypothetical protein